MLISNSLDYTDEEKRQAWNRAIIIPGYDSSRYRQDIAGAWIGWDYYGNTDKELGLGWEIDHIKPLSKNGQNTAGNRRALHWKNNRAKSDDYPIWKSEISSNGNQNIYKTQKWEITE